MGEKLEDILETCRLLHAMIGGFPIAECDRCHGWKVQINESDDIFFVGTHPYEDKPEAIGAGAGSTIEAAARDWRSRLARAVNGDIDRHISYKTWLENRGLRGLRE